MDGIIDPVRIVSHVIKDKKWVDVPCPDVYEFSLKGTSCLIRHGHEENDTYYLCDKHYEIYKNHHKED